MNASHSAEGFVSREDTARYETEQPVKYAVADGIATVTIEALFDGAKVLGGANNDAMSASGFASNNAGGILAGISSGQDIVVRAAHCDGNA